jgi:hypothetical protein
MKGLPTHCEKRRKNLVEYPFAPSKGLLRVAHYLPLEYFAVCSSLQKPCAHMWRLVLLCRIIMAARSR